MRKISKVILFNNSNIAVFDENDEQITELQDSLIVKWANSAEQLGYDIENLIIDTQNGQQFRLYTYVDEDGKTETTYEIL